MGRIRETVATMVAAARYSLSFCWRHSKRETVGRITISVMNTFLVYGVIHFTGAIVNAVQNSQAASASQMDQIFWQVFGLAGVLLIGVILGRFNWFFRSRWQQVLRFANQQELNSHRANLDVGRTRSKEFDDLCKQIQELPSSWGTRITFADETFNLFTTVVSFVLFGVSLLWYEPIYALVLVLVSLPMVVFDFHDMNRWWKLFEELVPHHKWRHVIEKPYHHKTAFVQALMFNQMPTLSHEAKRNTDFTLSRYDDLRRRSIKQEIVTHLLATAGLIGVIAHAIWSVTTSGGEIGTLTVVMAASRTFQSNFESIVSHVAEQWNTARGIILIEKDFLGLKPMIETKNPLDPEFAGVPHIRFDRVSFTYPGSETEVLKDVSFTIEPGIKLAIVGQSGNGKSTLQHLLMRHYDPTAGAIYADGINLQSIKPEVWNQYASALAQEYTILERKIAEEIASSRFDKEIDMDAVRAASRFANFDNVVQDDPQGFDSQIGVEFGGREFSGGERHRLALARVHYRRTPILILDEPDASLDPESAHKIIEQVFALQGVTVILITHHVSRAERCDKVLVMGKGRIVEQGAHAELLTRGGTYARMYEKDKRRLTSSAAEA